MREREEPTSDSHLFAPAVTFFALLAAAALGAGWVVQAALGAI